MILVSGGSGLVGSHLLYHLLKSEAHDQLRAIYRSEESKNKCKKVFSFYGAEKLYSCIEWVKADITDYISLEKCFEGVSHVYHAAAIVSFDERLEKQLLEVNIEGTKNMVNLCLQRGIEKMIYISSVAALGEYRDGSCSDEIANWQNDKNKSTYAISKFYAENEVWRGAAEGLSVGIINPSTILGYGNWNDSSLILIKKVAEGLKFYPPGTNGFVGVKDVVAAAIQLMKSDVSGERYLVSAENLSFKVVFELIAKEFNRRPPSIVVSRKMANLLLLIDRLRSFLFRLPRLLPASNLETIFKQRCFSADKFKKDFDYQFEPIASVIKELAPAFKSEQ